MSAASARLAVPGALVLAMSVALALRVGYQWRRVFRGPHVNFLGGDAWYHMRLVDHLLLNFPHRMTVDPYLGYPDPTRVSVGPFFDVLIAAVAWLVGFGSPSPQQVDAVGAWLPPSLGIAAIVPAYALGARLFDRGAGMAAAAFLAVMPGAFLGRSQLGYADHHVLETLLALLTLLALAIACRTTRTRSVVAAALAGVALGAYLLTWTSGAFLVGIGAAWLIVQRAVDALQGTPRHLGAVVGLTLAIATATVLAFQPRAVPRYGTQLATLAGAAVVLVGLEALGRLWAALRLPARLLPVGLLVIGLGVMAVAAALRPGVLAGALSDLARLTPGTTDTTVSEVRPLLLVAGSEWSLRPLLTEFGSTFLPGVVGLIGLGISVWRSGRPDRCLALVATAAFLVATFGQNRFGYYLAPMLAVLSGWLAAIALARAGAGLRAAAPRWRRTALLTLTLLIAALGIGPGLAVAVLAVRNDGATHRAWMPALEWLRAASPEPFGDPGFYTARYDDPPRRRPAYTVMAWWDHGYEILRVARRVPYANPTQAGAGLAAEFFTATDEASALRVLDAAASRYVIVDFELPFSPSGTRQGSGKFHWLAIWAKTPPSTFVLRLERRRPDGSRVPVAAFLPAYYRSMAVRLEVFGGRAAVPRDSTWVIEYLAHPPRNGDRGYAELLRAHRFPTYEAAVDHVRIAPPGSRVIVGFDPLETCVPLEPLERLRLVHDVGRVQPSNLDAVRIFEVVGR